APESVHMWPRARTQAGEVSGGAADIEHAVLRLNSGKLNQPRQDHRRQQETCRRAVERRKDLDRLIDIGEAGELRRHEALAGQRAHGRKQTRFGDLVGTELRLHHIQALALEAGHPPSLATLQMGTELTEARASLASRRKRR